MWSCRQCNGAGYKVIEQKTKEQEPIPIKDQMAMVKPGKLETTKKELPMYGTPVQQNNTGDKDDIVELKTVKILGCLHENRVFGTENTQI